MSQTLTIAKRELSALFFSPIAYLVLGIFTFIVSTLLLLTQFSPGFPAEIREELTWIVRLLMFVAPAISMRLLSEELKEGTIELLMTAPISDAQVGVGKWLGAICFFGVLMSPILVQVVVLEIKANPDYGPIFTGLLGLLLVGGLYMAIGTCISAMTDSQLISYLITALITGGLTIGMYILSVVQWVPNSIKNVLYYINVDQQFDGFSKGLIDVRNLLFFVSGIILFLFLGVKMLESRRWR